jgi:hypothetical protein
MMASQTADPGVEHLRLPPHSIEAEQALLGSAMADKAVASRMVETVRPADFYRDAHRFIYEAIATLLADGGDADAVTVAEALRAAGKLAYVGDLAYLGALVQAVPTTANATHYAGIIRDHAQRRALAAAANSIADEAIRPGAKVGDLVRDAQTRLEAIGSTGQTPIAALDIAELAAEPMPAQDARIERMAYCGTLGLMGAHGGIGKTQIAIAAAIAMAAGCRLFGQAIKPCKTALISAEDGAGELHRRLAVQCHAMQVNFASLHGRAFVYDYTAGDPTLVAVGRDGVVTPTARYLDLRRDLRRHDVEFVALDNFALLAAVDIIRPREATAALALLAELAPPGGNVIVLAHVDKATAKTGYSTEGYTGSAAFNNRPRFRWFAYRPNADGDGDGGGDPPEDDGRRTLEVQKLNGGKRGLRIALRIVTADGPSQGAIVLDGTDDGMVASIARRNEQRDVLAAVREAQARAIPIPTAETNRSTAYEALEAMPSYPDDLRGKRGKARLFHLLRRLRADGAIEVGEFRTAGRKSREGYRIAPIQHNESAR